MAKKLPPRQERFVQEYLIDPNATKAAIKAGYSKKTAQEQGSRLLSKVMIAEAVAKGQAASAERNQVTLDEIIEGIRSGIDWAKGLDNPAAYMKGYELLGKTVGAYTEKHEHSGGTEVRFIDQTGRGNS